MSRVLVIGRSPITCLVVSKIAERAGLKPVTEKPEAAAARLAALNPGLVIVDGGPDDRDCEPFLPTLTGSRRAGGGTLPAAILLSTANSSSANVWIGGAIDAVVLKPITPENLQPVIQQLIGRF